MQVPRPYALPGSVLFACTMNSVRSPMAEAILRYFQGHRIFVQSAGVKAGEIDPLMVEVMDEVGIDLAKHRPRTFDQLDDDFFDLVISLSPQAHHRAIELTRTSSCEIEFWLVPDPTLTEGNRQQCLDAYRGLRDELVRRIKMRFPRDPGGDV